MSKEGKLDKHDAKHKHHKRKRDEMEPGKLSNVEKKRRKEESNFLWCVLFVIKYG